VSALLRRNRHGSRRRTCSKCKVPLDRTLGAGMVDPSVYGFVNYDAKKVSGFAFGIGIDRLAMLKYGIDIFRSFPKRRPLLAAIP